MLFIALFLFLTQLEKRVVIELIMLPIQDLIAYIELCYVPNILSVLGTMHLVLE